MKSTTLTLPAGPSGNPLAAGDFLAVNGFSTAFGTAPPDYLASAINAEPTIPARLQVLWTTTSSAPFATADANGVTVNLTGSPLSSATIVAAAGTNDPTSGLPLFRPVLSVGSNLVGISGFNSFTPFEAAVTAVLPTAPATKLLAYGFYNRATNTFTASRIDLVL